MNSLTSVGVAASIGALGIAVAPPLASPPPTPPPTLAAREVRLVADSVPLGAIPAAFLRNQLTFCELICPSIVQLVTTVPLGVVEAPGSFVEALQSGSLLQAIGAAAESVTAPADVATTGIINPDVFIVVPKSVGKTLQVTVVQAINVAEALLRPGELGPAVETAREKILEALDEPATFPPSDLPTGAQGVLENVAVAAVSIPVAVAFQAGELLLEGAVHTANVTATELADTGNVGEALSAGGAAATAVLGQAGGIVTDAVDTALTNISDARHQPAPSTTVSTTTATAGTKATTVSTTTATANTKAARPAIQRLNRAVQRVTNGPADLAKHRKAPGGRHRASSGKG
jgi:hypothetical protein